MAELFRKAFFDILDFAGAHPRAQQAEHGPHNPFGLVRGGVPERLSDLRDKFAGMTHIRRRGGRAPTLVIGTPQQERKLRSKRSGDIHGQAVAQNVEGFAQGPVGETSVIGIEKVPEVLEPDIREMKGLVKDLSLIHI